MLSLTPLSQDPAKPPPRSVDQDAAPPMRSAAIRMRLISSRVI